MEAEYRRTARALLALFVVLILYGSFYPFQFDAEWAKLRFSAPMDYWLVSDAPRSRSDTLFNTLAYLPIGLLLAVLLHDKRSFPQGLLFATLCGGLLSFVVEIAQNAFRTRYATLIDLVTNTAGTAIGFALTAVALRTRPSFVGGVLNRLSKVPFAAWALLLLWGLLHAAPFVLSGFYKLRLALRYLAEWNWNVAGVARWLAAWLILMVALRRVVAPRFFLLLYFALAVFSPPVRLLIRGQSLGPNELIAGVIALPFLVFRKPQVAMWTVLACLVVAGLAPFEFQPVRNSMGWLPFGSVLEVDPDRSFLSLIEKTYLYLGAVWLVVESGMAAVPAGVAVAAMLALVEVGQMYIPGRTPETTDPVMALLAILVVTGNRARQEDSATEITASEHL